MGQVAQNEDIALLYGKRVLLDYSPVAEMCSSVAEVVLEWIAGRRSRSPISVMPWEATEGRQCDAQQEYMAWRRTVFDKQRVTTFG